MVEIKEDLFKSLTRGTGIQLRKIKSILPELICEDGKYNFGNQIYLYTRGFFCKEYLGRISYDAKTPNTLNMNGEPEILKPIAEKLEKHGYQVTIYY